VAQLSWESIEKIGKKNIWWLKRSYPLVN
jgi:hypothetical protein